MDIKDLMKEYKEKRGKLNLFDVNCWIGNPLTPQFTFVKSISETKKKLNRYGIKRAVVSHVMAKEYNHIAGNEILIKEIKNFDEFLGAAVIIPGIVSISEFKSYIKFLILNKIRLIRLFPKAHNFLLSDWYAKEFLSILEEYNIPIVLWHKEVSWDMVSKICSAYPLLNIIIEGAEIKLFYHNKIYYKLMEKFPNFYLEIYNLVNYLGLDDIVKKFGSERLIFGTYFPFSDPNTSIMLLTHGNFTTKDKKNIAYKNLEKIVNNVRGC